MAIACSGACEAALPDTRRPADRVPVVLVHGAFSSPDQCWGAENDTGGLYSFLTGRGYEPGVTLFRLDYSDDPAGDYAQLYRRLGAFVELARARAGIPAVDIVAHSTGALLARYYVNSPSYAGGVRNLVMISPPNNGSFLATALRSALARIAHEAHRFDGPRPAKQPGKSQVSREFPEFRDEFDYVSRRAATFYEPLYGDFLLDTRVLGPAGAAGRGRFEDWLERERADAYRACFTGALDPPLQPDWDMGEAPPPGKDLTRAYYERIALEVGRHNYVRFAGTGGTLADVMLRSPLPLTGDVKQIAREYALRLLAYYAARLGDLAVTKGKEIAAGFLDSRLGLRADSAVLRRLVTREIRVARSSQALPANHFLNRWNEAETATRWAAGQPVRYVTVTGGALLPSLPLSGETGENDGAVEVLSSHLPQCPDDVFRVFRGAVWPHHGAFVRRPEVHRFVASQLECYYPVKCAHTPSFRSGWLKWWRWSETGHLSASAWEPSYVLVDGASLDGHGGTLTIRVSHEGTPAGVALKGWVHRFSRDGSWAGREEIPLGQTGVGQAGPGQAGDGAAHSALAAVARFGSDLGKVLIGFRLTGECRSDSDLRRLERLDVAVRYSLAFEPDGNDAGAGATPEGDGPAPGSVPGQDATPGTTPRQADASTGIPTIHVVRTSRQTVPSSSLTGEHSVWEWDFGDGQALTDQEAGPVSSARHSFERPGRYCVRARSRDSRGKVLREETWDVTAGEDASAEPLEFTAGGPDPGVRVVVSGPQMWVTGRPAVFRVSVDASPSGAEAKQVITVEPGREFRVAWQRPGVFEVKAAARVRLTFKRPGGRVSVTRTYTGSTSVKVVATAVTG
ncbi:MAG: hypothetical protein HPY55_00215 [Firmicutes bacterium]|nr:hypothetical protein [Bacillota bacterium]